MRERAGKVAGAASLAIGSYYIVWRLLETLNPEHLLLSWLLWLGELWALLLSGAFVMAAWDVRSRAAPPPPDPGITVDVLVPTYDEPTWVVRRTLVASTAMRGTHRTWLLDDGDRPQMRALAAELGCRYLARQSSEGAKAGNLNHALRYATGALVAVFDADHAPDPAFLQRTVGLFCDEKLGFVQTPQEFYNTDSFQHFPGRRGLWHEQSLFFRVLQPGKDRWNSTFFCGSCAVVRRAALDDVGGFPVETVTEDLHLSLELHARGWRSAYVNLPLAFGLAPHDAEAYQSQRVRWGNGAMQVLSLRNPLTTSGLTLAQRIQYAHSLLFWFDGWRSLIFYAMPVIFLTTGILPISTTAAEFLPRFGAHAIATVATHQLLGHGHGGAVRNELFAMVRWWTLLRATTGMLTRRLTFAVTPKVGGSSRRPLAASMSIGAVAAASAAALTVGGWRVATGQETLLAAAAFNVGWATVHVVVAVWALTWLLVGTDRRERTRIAAKLPAGWRSRDGLVGLGEIVDVTERDARLHVRGHAAAFARGQTLELRVWPLRAGTLTAVVRRIQPTDGGVDLGMEWELEARQARWRELVHLVLLAHRHRGLLNGHSTTRVGATSAHEPVVVRSTAGTTLGSSRRDACQRRVAVLTDAAVAAGDWVQLIELDGAESRTYQIDCVELVRFDDRWLRRFSADRCTHSAAHRSDPAVDRTAGPDQQTRTAAPAAQRFAGGAPPNVLVPPLTGEQHNGCPRREVDVR